MAAQWQGTLAEHYERLDHLRRFVAAIDPDTVTGPQANELLEFFSKLERLGVAGKMLVAPVVDDRFVWRQEGYRSAAAFLADKTGTSVGQAIGVLECARQLGDLPETAACLRQGYFSQQQTAEVAAAATVHPGAEAELLEAAARGGLRSLRQHCRRTKALASWETDELAAYNAIRRSRFLRHWNDPDGGFRLEARLTPDGGARLLEAVRAKAAVLAEEARRVTEPESSAAYAADALVSLADDAIVGTGTGIGRPTVVLRVDLAALRRGETEADEVCEIPGAGAVPLSVAERMLGDSFVKIVVRDGCDIASVCHPGRTVPALMETALIERDRRCVVPGCDQDWLLENHHLVPVSAGGPTTLANLARICPWHHDLVTYEGWQLTGGPGSWCWHPPPDHSADGDPDPPESVGRLGDVPGDDPSGGAAARFDEL